VTDILYKEGENLAAGYPVIVVRNQEQVIDVGLGQTDAAKFSKRHDHGYRPGSLSSLRQ